MTSDNATVAGFGGNGWGEVTNQRLEGAVIDRAFLAAHLLTGSPEQAECAVLEAIASWSPDRSQDELFEKVLHAAVRGAAEDAQSLANEADSPDTSLPGPLQAVLRLAPLVRQCYVLRVLVRLPRKACASLLDLSLQRVDQYTCAALRCLPLLAQPTSAATEYAA